MKDILFTICCVILVVAGFYAFQLLVLGIVGLVIYWTLPLTKRFLASRPTNKRSSRSPKWN